MLLDIDEAESVTGRNRRTLYNRAQSGQEPQPLRRGRGARYRYRAETIAAYIGASVEDVVRHVLDERRAKEGG